MTVNSAQSPLGYGDNERSQNIPSEFRGPRRKDDYLGFIGTNQVVPGISASTSTRSSLNNQGYEVPPSRSGKIRSSKSTTSSPSGSIQHRRSSQKTVRFDLDDSASSSSTRPAHKPGTRRRLISRRVRVADPDLYARISRTVPTIARVEYATSVQPMILETPPITDYLYSYGNQPVVNYLEQLPQYLGQSDQLFYAHPQSFYPPASTLVPPGQSNHVESPTKESSTKSSFGSIAGDFGTIEKFFSSLTLASVFGPLFEKMQMLKKDLVASYGRKIGQFDFLASFTSHQEREHDIGMKLVARMYAEACRGHAKGLNDIMRQLHELGFLVGANLSDCTPSNDGNNTWNHMVNLMTLRASELMGGKSHPDTGSHMLLGSENIKFDPSHAQMQGAKIAENFAMPSPVPWQDLD